MIKSSIKKIIDGTPKEVWDIITNNEDYGWRSDLSKIEIVDETKFIEIAKNNFPTNFTITKKEPCQRYEFDIENKNIKGHWIGILKEVNNKTEIEFTEEVEVGNVIMKLLAKPYLKKQQKQYIDDLKKKLSN